MMEASNSSRTRPSQACEVCHEKKIRCDLAEAGPPCSNCRISDAFCRPHQRKRKRPLRPSSSEAQSFLEDKESNLQTHSRRRFSAQEIDVRSSITFNPSDKPIQISGIEAPSGNQQEATPPATSEDTEGVIENTPESRSYLGRSEYLGVAASQTNEGTTDAQPEKTNLLSHEERVTLEVYRAFDLPPPSVQRSLIESFQRHCAPWMPIVEDNWLHMSGSNQPSLLLLQSVFLAGSRVAAAPYISSSAEQYYRRAKILFFSSYEKNPIIKIASACLLNWWNPRGPEEVSLDGSSFWLRVAVSVAYQIGLHREPPAGKTAKYRRRLWWTLVARDCQLSAAHGRPRAITLSDSNVAPPSTLDFGREACNAELFVAFVRINTILADVTKAYLRHQISQPKKREIRNALYCWVNELPPSLRLFEHGKLRPYSLCTRSLYIAYFVTLTILYRSPTVSDMSTSVTVVAASFVAGICEEFLMRDDLRFLGPIFKFHLFAASMALLNARSHLLETEFTPALHIIRTSLSGLAERWPSAKRNIEIIDEIAKSTPPQAHEPRLLPITEHHEAKGLFHDLGPELCSLWHLLDAKSGYVGDSQRADVQFAYTENEDVISSVIKPTVDSLDQMDTLGSVAFMEQVTSDGSMDPGTLWTWPDMRVGNWLIDSGQVGLFAN